MRGMLLTLGRVFVWMHACHICAVGYLYVSACGDQKTAWAANPRVLPTLLVSQATSLFWDLPLS